MTQRGKARTFGQDLMRGEGGGMPGRASPGGSARPSADYAKNRARGDGAGRAAPGGSRLPAAKLGADSKSPRANLPSAPPPGLTWVGGDRPPDEMDEVSRKILAAQPASGASCASRIAFLSAPRRGNFAASAKAPRQSPAAINRRNVSIFFGGVCICALVK